ncbi:MAG: GNAT family N-acetyltransferase, partial [Tatlockia sp.]|nr:GNAT family N-acetyltransferase [Tatlockia sp.]
MDVEIVPCSVEHLEKLIEGDRAFFEAYGFQVADGYLPSEFKAVLQHSLNEMQAEQIWHPWLCYLFFFHPDRVIVGLGGFKSVPDDNRTVEIGYSVASSYQNRGVATSAVKQLIEIAIASPLVDCVCAHTLAEPNASTRVLQKCGMT